MHNAARCLRPLFDGQGPSVCSVLFLKLSADPPTLSFLSTSQPGIGARRLSWPLSAEYRPMLPRHRLYTWTVLILLSSLAQCAPLSSDAKSGALAARSAPSTLSTALDTYYGGKSSSKGPSTINLSDIQVLQELHLDAAARYARAAYCAQVSEGATWTCGTACDATPGTEVIWTFGDNKRVPYGR